ncbi:hypothetical protein GCM10009554_48720 [Kribbella koreensis]|uniref:Zinc finger protein n=1 Tax=Kribbella koreensis TaxID=57909 RepID=A0ABP4BG57_9ACTN
MAGRMKDECREARPIIAEALTLDLSLPETTNRHLRTCDDCLAEADGIRRTVVTLGLATSPAFLPATVAETRSVGRRRSNRWRALTAAAAAIVVVGGFLLTGSAAPEATQPSAAVIERAGKMTTHPWGTEIPVSVTGLESGRSYRLVATDAHGVRGMGGSVTGASGQVVRVRMVTALRKESITAVLLEQDDGVLVTRLAISPAR